MLLERPTIKIPNSLTLRALLIVVLLEVFLGGGGRLIDTGPLSIRMYLFSITLFFSVLFILYGVPFNRNFALLLFIATSLFGASAIIGAVNGARFPLIFNDVKPLLSFYSLVFFFFMIRTKEDVFLILRLIKLSALILASVYIFILVLIHTDIIPFLPFYAYASETEEFFFRGEFAFFYKGFIYICIGLFFFVSEEKINKHRVFLLIAAIILTFTRGFFISTILTYLFYLAYIKQSFSKIIVYSLIVAAAVVSFWSIVYTEKIDRTDSDSARVLQIKEVGEMITPLSAVVGHGFGIGVTSRPERMEIAFLEIFHKQGLIGIAFWGLVIVLCWMQYQRCAKTTTGNLAAPFFLAVLLIFLQSFTNPYVNNPIGITMILISLVSLNVLAKDETVSGEQS